MPEENCSFQARLIYFKSLELETSNSKILQRCTEASFYGIFIVKTRDLIKNLHDACKVGNN